ncbi:MAG: VOC family protein [Roseovarius sp.]|nr:VOC family protein [Roseovarius sp.]
MKLTLHHINLATDRVKEMAGFYRDALGLKVPDDDVPVLEVHQRADGAL